LTTAPYGRYNDTKRSRMYGPDINVVVAWILQECPSFLVPLICIYLGKKECVSSPVNMILLALFLIHYANRVWVYPCLIRGGKSTPLMIMLAAFSFCVVNGYMQGRYLTYFATYPASWLYDPRFILGIILFFTGMFINCHSDSILRNLRKPGETGYKIPKGGMFEYVSGANFFGELVEWAGFLLAGWSLVATAFFVTTFCNIGPRSLQHHKWYLSKFENYPKNRKAFIPFLW